MRSPSIVSGYGVALMACVLWTGLSTGCWDRKPRKARHSLTQPTGAEQPNPPIKVQATRPHSGYDEVVKRGLKRSPGRPAVPATCGLTGATTKDQLLRRAKNGRGQDSLRLHQRHRGGW